MSNTNWTDFFKVNGEYAMRNLTVFVTMVVASWIVIYLAIMGTLTEWMFAAYLAAGGGIYSYGKKQDEQTARSQINVDSEPAPITIPDAKNVAVKGGKVTVNQKKKGEIKCHLSIRP